MLRVGVGTELKRQYTDDIKKTVIAFANTDGGTIHTGIEDDGTVIGIENIDKTMLSITNMIRDSIHPDVTLFTDVNTVDIEEKTVIRIDILRGTERPYYIKGKGIRPEGIYVRQGASSVPASHAAIVKMIKETSSDNFEEAISIEQALSFSKADEAFRNHSINFDDNNKRTLGLIRHDGLYTNLALLLSDQCPHSIKAARFQGTDKAIFTDRVEISGSVFQQMDEAYEYLQKNNRVSSEFKGLERVDHLDYPEEALRESLINAVVHREYAIPGPVLISIFDDRIEITALGGLTKELSLDDIMLGVSVLRNKKLGDIFYRLKLIEAYGTGIEKIMRSYDNCSEKPKIDISDNAFKITLPNQNYHKNTASPKKEIDYREQTIMDLFKEKETIARKDIQEALDVSQATAILLARELVEKDILLKESGGKYQRYRLNEIKK